MDEEIVILISQEGDSFTMSRQEAEMSLTIVDLIKEVGDYSQPIVLSEIGSKSLLKIVEFCRHHKNDLPPPPLTEEQQMLRDFPDPLLVLREPYQMSDWDKKFVKNMDVDTCIELSQCAAHLHIDKLSKVMVKASADHFVGMKHTDILAMYEMDPITEEEEEAIVREHPWLANRYLETK